MNENEKKDRNDSSAEREPLQTERLNAMLSNLGRGETEATKESTEEDDSFDEYAAIAEPGKRDPEPIAPDPVCFEEAIGSVDAGDNAASITIHLPDASAASEKQSVEMSASEAQQSGPEDDLPQTETGTELPEDEVHVEQVPPKHTQKKYTVQIVLLIIALVILVGIVVAAGFALLYHPTIETVPGFTVITETGEFSADTDDVSTGTGEDEVTDDEAGKDEADEAVPVLEATSYARREGVYNFLVLGVDRAANLSDVIMIVSFDVKNLTLHVASLPRDSYIDTGSNYHTVNSYFAASYNHSYGTTEERYTAAVESMVSFLEKGLCVQIDRYICMDTAGFRDIVDAVGGVDVDVPIDMDYEDPEQDLYIHLQAGLQHLDGNEAEQFVRFRKAYLNGDLGRISAQKLFLTAFAQQVRNNMSLSTAVSIAKACLKYVTTDLTAAEIGYFVRYAVQCDFDNIVYMTFPGGAAINPNTSTGYYVLYAGGVRELVNQYLNVFTQDISQSVFLSNSVSFTSDLDYIKQVFLSENYSTETVTAEDVEENSVTIPTR